MADPTDDQIASMGRVERLEAALNRVLDKVPAEAADQIKQLLTPQALHTIEGVVALWLLSHWIGIGEVFDALLLATGIVALGYDAVKAAKSAIDGFIEAASARTFAEIDEAAKKIADAIAIVGIDMLATLLLRYKRPNVPHPNPAGFPRAPEIVDGGWRYRPKTYAYPFPEGKPYSRAAGLTDTWGDIHINTRYSLGKQQEAMFHELVHRALKPKIDIFRRLRSKWTIGSYKNSYLRRYLEEALCQTAALVQTKGFKFSSIVGGLRFPLNGYYDLNIVQVAQEVGEIFLGPIKVGDDIYQVGLIPAGQPSTGDNRRFMDVFDAKRLSAGVR